MSEAALDRLRRQQPEWRPWLIVVEAILREVSAPVWDDAVRATVLVPHTGVPLLSGAELAIAPDAVCRLFDRLVETARRRGTSRMATLAKVARTRVDLGRLFRASLYDERDDLDAIARDNGADPEVFQGVAALLPVPFLQACNRRWGATVQPGWIEPYCPVCGSWPAFVEVRGIERSRCFRCRRCGSEWHARMLRCPYCGLDDHHRLATLAPEGGGHRAIEACGDCLGYVKSFTTLGGCAPEAVMVEDLASVDLDLAALDLGYARPKTTGFRLEGAGAESRGTEVLRHMTI